jgi:hypothetical protein
VTRKRKKTVDWAERAKALRPYGYKFKSAPTDTEKRRIRRAINKHGDWIYSKNPERVEFIKGTPSKGVLPDSQVTPTGFFVKRPTGVEKDEYKVALKKGIPVFKIRGQTEELLSLRQKSLVLNPLDEIKRAIGNRKGVKARLVINGFDGHEVFSVQRLAYYMSELWLDELDEENMPTIQLKVISRYETPKAKNQSPKRKKPNGKVVRGNRSRN